MDRNDRPTPQHHHGIHHHHHQHHLHHHERFEPPPVCPVEHLSAAVQSLDTVRALHSTVVSLRSALEEAHREIDQLKKQIAIGEDIESGREFRRSQDNLNAAEKPANAVTEPTKDTPKKSPPASPKVPSARKSRRLSSTKQGSYAIRVLPEDIRITSSGSGTGSERRKPMASKIDVKIKVSSNFKRNKSNTDDDQHGDDDGETGSSAANAEGSLSEMISTESDSHADTEPSDVEVAPPEPIAVPADAKSTPTSDGDNSVFEETAQQPTASSSSTTGGKPHTVHTEHSEEVDDIELIFSADDKDFVQQDDEDLVSITGDYEPWAKTGKSGTPVLVNFGSIGSDMEAGATAADASDADVVEMARDDSYDTFYPLTNSTSYLGGGTGGLRWTNQNVLIETDISKCGIVDEPYRLDLSRRNTCPNPPAYRPLIHREAMAAINQQTTTTIGNAAATGSAAAAAARSLSRTPLAVKFSRNSRSANGPPHQPLRAGVLRDIGNVETMGGHTAAMADGQLLGGPKRHSAAQTEISALPEHWRSESHLVGGDGGALSSDGGFYTLPSKFVPPATTSGGGGQAYAAKAGNQTQEARRVLLSDINFTSMVPELSRSADHLCQAENTDPNRDAVDATAAGSTNYKGLNHLQTPEYAAASASMRGITPSTSMHTSPGVSQWTVNSNNTSGGGGSNSQPTNQATVNTQTNTDSMMAYCRHDSTDSCRSGYSLSSRGYTTSIGGTGTGLLLHKSSRSRSVPSVARFTLCRSAPLGGHHHHGHHHHHHHHHSSSHHAHVHYSGQTQPQNSVQQHRQRHQPLGMRGSESMHYTPRVTFQEPGRGAGARSGGVKAVVRGSLPDLRTECACSVVRCGRMLHANGDGGSSGSTDSLLDEADDLMRSSSGMVAMSTTDYKRSASGGLLSGMTTGAGGGVVEGAAANRRFSENDIKRDYSPSKQSLPFLPKSPKCLKLGHLVKVITRTGRVVVGRVRYIGPLAGADFAPDETFVGLQLPSKVGDCDGSIEGRRFFECAPQHGIFVAFKKIIMAWTA